MDWTCYRAFVSVDRVTMIANKGVPLLIRVDSRNCERFGAVFLVATIEER